LQPAAYAAIVAVGLPIFFKLAYATNLPQLLHSVLYK
jgi:hypothetical protein